MHRTWIIYALGIFGSMSLTAARPDTLIARATSPPAPTPISVDPSQYWEGDDGPWSSFTLQVGTPAQDVRVFISTASQVSWVVLENIGCKPNDGTCADARGTLFNMNVSSTWHSNGFWQLYNERNLGIDATGLFGNDTIGLGIQGSGGPTLQNQILAAIGTEHFYLGMFAVNPKRTNYTGIASEGQASYMTSLKEQNLIPSVSFGYTAGAPYRLKKVLGSLTLGGYDQARFTPNQMSFSFAPDTDRDIVVSIQDITSKDQDGSTNRLLPTAINAYIDSTIAQIWLPIEACQAFEKAFGLKYDEDNQIYPVSDAQHERLLAQNASISFTLGNSPTGGNTTVITLPYDSFDLEATPPFSPNRTKYFPLQRAANETQYTLGRTFLQEAYLIVDWERGNFSVSQCVFDPNNLQEKLLPIDSVNGSANGTSTSHHSSTNTGEIIGIAVGVAAVIVLITIWAIVFCVRRKRKQRQQADPKKSETEDDESDKIRQGFAKAELDADIGHARYEMGGSNDDHAGNAPAGWVEEKARHPGQHAELMGDKMLPELTAGGVAASELSSQRGLFGPCEMYDPSAPPVELPADMPRELPAPSPSFSSLGLTSSSSISRTVDVSPVQRSAGSSPLHQLSGNTSPVNNQTRSTFQSRSSTTRPSRSRPSAPFQDSDSSRSPSTPSKSRTSSLREHEPFSPISPIGNGEDGSDNGALFSLIRGLEPFDRPVTKPGSKPRRQNEF